MATYATAGSSSTNIWRSLSVWLKLIPISLVLSCALPSEPEESEDFVLAPLPCEQSLVVWPVEEYRTVLRRVTVEHEYDDCSSMLVYYEPLEGEAAYPPCWGHGGTTMYDGTIWACIDGTTRETQKGPSRPFDGTACTGLDLGCAYGFYRYVIP